LKAEKIFDDAGVDKDKDSLCFPFVRLPSSSLAESTSNCRPGRFFGDGDRYSKKLGTIEKSAAF